MCLLMLTAAWCLLYEVWPPNLRLTSAIYKLPPSRPSFDYTIRVSPSFLPQCALLTVVDRDVRDMTFDYRVTREGIARYHGMLATAYWPTDALIPINWTSDVLRPSVDIPVVAIIVGTRRACSGPGGVNICRQVACRTFRVLILTDVGDFFSLFAGAR